MYASHERAHGYVDADGVVGVIVASEGFSSDGMKPDLGVLLFHHHKIGVMGERFSEDGVRRRRNTRPKFRALLRDRTGDCRSCDCRSRAQTDRERERARNVCTQMF